ncbi:hypothetical protein GQ457_12G005140 [Hibiscus cannabinus]
MEIRTRSVLELDDDNGGFFDLGHPLLNHVAHSFLKASGVHWSNKGCCRRGFSSSSSRHANSHACIYLYLIRFLSVISYSFGAGNRSSSFPDHLTAPTANNNKKHPFPYLRGIFYYHSVCAHLIDLYTGLAAGLYSGITYGLREARGTHDWKNSAVAGALTGMTVALACEEGSHEQLLQCAITGAAISTAANLLNGIF